MRLLSMVLVFCFVGTALADSVPGDNGEIVGVVATASSTVGGSSVDDIVNGVGLDTFGQDTHHIVWPGTMWLSSGSTPVGEWVEFDLGGLYDLTNVNVWNFNERYPTYGMLPENVNHGRGVKDMNILVAGADHVFGPFSNVTLNEAGDGAPIFDIVPLVAPGVQYVKFDILSNLNSDWVGTLPYEPYVGLSEVMFHGVGVLLPTVVINVTAPQSRAVFQQHAGYADVAVAGSLSIFDPEVVDPDTSPVEARYVLASDPCQVGSWQRLTLESRRETVLNE